jgi:hypothetical protein
MAHNRKLGVHVCKAVQAVVFMATPHGGSTMAGPGAFFSKLWATARGQKSTASVDQLKTMSTTLKSINTDFVDTASSLEILTFYETKTMPYVGMVSCPIVGVGVHLSTLTHMLVGS